MKYFILAGEASGDLHASNLIKAIKELDPDADIIAWGGDLMAAAGATVEKHIRELAFMGFIEVIANIGTVLRNFSIAKKSIMEFQPDKIIFIDYPGFNLRMAKWAKSQGFQTVFYIAPQAWAWKEGRTKQLKKFVDQLIVILPFETEWFAKRGVNNEYFGHPLLDTEILDEGNELEFRKSYQLGEKRIIALLPGSRQQELKRMEAVYLEVAQKMDDFQFVVAGAPGRSLANYQNYIDRDIPVIFENTYSILHHSSAALVTSGTATLETAIIGCPMIVCYKTSQITYSILKNLVKVPYISLVNLIADKKVVPELIQDDCNSDKIVDTLTSILDREKSMQKTELLAVRNKLGSAGVSRRIAEAILRKNDESVT